MQLLAAGRVDSVVRPTLAVLLLSLALAGTAGSTQAPSTAPAAERAGAGRWEAAIERGRATLQAMIDRGEAPGCSVAVAVGGQVVWSEGFGWADLEQRVPATAATRFGIGSISKSLTAAGLVALADAGLLDLDAPVERYVPAFPYPGRGVTLRRIASHQSGLADEIATRLHSTTEHFATVEAAYATLREERLVCKPGSRAEYATGSYTLLGRAMEAAAERGFVEVLQQRVFAPAGMTGVIANDPRRLIPGRTRFYLDAEGGGFENAPTYDPSHKLPGAGFLTTAEDLARFGAALLRPGMLSERGRAELFGPVPLADGTATEFALGFRAKDDDGHRLLHQPGGGIGISAWLFVYPDDDLVVALLSNVPTGPVGGATRRAITDAFFAAMSE
jgi:CubicO group peptidase (beta-lactamase class C family)